jgi:hypothetical protein
VAGEYASLLRQWLHFRQTLDIKNAGLGITIPSEVTETAIRQQLPARASTVSLDLSLPRGKTRRLTASLNTGYPPVYTLEAVRLIFGGEWDATPHQTMGLQIAVENVRHPSFQKYIDYFIIASLGDHAVLRSWVDEDRRVYFADLFDPFMVDSVLKSTLPFDGLQFQLAYHTIPSI